MAFDRLPQQDVVTWSTVIAGYALHGLSEEAFQLFQRMQQEGIEPNHVTCICLMKACSITGSLAQGKQIHFYAVDRGLDSDILIGNSLTDMYSKCGSLEDACLVFQKLQVRDVVAWNVLIAGYAQHGDGEKALQLFRQMQQQDMKPDETTLVSILQACSNIEALKDGELAHNHVIENGFGSNVYVGNTLILMYSKCGRLQDACTVFHTLPFRDVVTWNALISGYSQHGYAKEAFELFEKMQNLEVEPNYATFVSTLQACSSIALLEQGTCIHTHIVRVGCESDFNIGSALISMYARCGSIEDTYMVFCRLPRQSVVTWNALITCFAQHGEVQEALQFFGQMQQERIELTKATSIFLVKACCGMENLGQAMQIHAYIIKSGLGLDTSVGNSLIDMYVRWDKLEDACLVFNRVPNRNATSWSALMEGYVQEGHTHKVLQLFEQMVQEVVELDKVAFVCLLGVCSRIGALVCGMQIHIHIIKFGFESDIFVANTLINMYAKCGSLYDAYMVFGSLSTRDVVTWNALIAGSVQHGHCEEALHLFQQMQEEGLDSDQVTFVCMLQACSDLAALDIGQEIHIQMIKRGLDLDLLASNTLIDMYAKCSSIVDALFMFSRLPKRDTVSWNVLIGAAAQEGFAQEAIHMFYQMQMECFEPNQITFVSVLQACSNVAGLEEGRQIHSKVIEKGYDTDLFVGSTLIDMYAKCQSPKDAHKTFISLPKKNAIVWNALISGYAQHGHAQEALQLFWQMQDAGEDATSVTFLSILPSLESLDEGRRVHAHIIESGLLDFVLGSSLIDMYGKCGHLNDAAMVFDKFHKQDVLVWSALISSHLDSGHAREALQLFKQMRQEVIEPDKVTFILTLRVCSSMTALEQGKQIHSLIIESGLESEISVGNTLIDMYADCGSLEDANIMFCRLPERDVVTWSAMISGYAEHNNYVLALHCFENMQQQGLTPDNVTYLSILSACNNAGLVDEGCLHLRKMREKHGIAPTVEHYNCIIDLLGRNGCINEAQDLLETLLFRSDIVAWTSLLGSCKMHSNLTIGRQCFDHAVAMKSKSAAGYVFMSNIYAQFGMQKDSENVELLRRHEKMWKKPGKAFIEIDSQVHEFTVGDNSHPRTNDIHAKLKTLNLLRRNDGHSPCLDLTQESVLDEEKEVASCGHCEKLAVALGLVCLPQGTTIRVSKNLRVCTDCHNAVKMISKIESREIILADTKCIHQFKDGVCCCNGYS